MARIAETLALNLIEDGLNTLRSQYSVAGGAENRRDQIKQFLSVVFSSVERLADAVEGDGATIEFMLPGVLQDIDCAFLDAIEAEEARIPRLDPVKHHGTHNHTMTGVRA